MADSDSTTTRHKRVRYKSGLVRVRVLPPADTGDVWPGSAKKVAQLPNQGWKPQDVEA